MSELVCCPRCRRHVRVRERACPFCGCGGGRPGRRTALVLAALSLGAVHCREPDVAAVYGGPPPSASPDAAVASTTPPEPVVPPPSSAGATLPSTPDVIPPGSGNYSEVLALVTRYRRGKMGWAELERAIVARKLPPHRLGDDYLLTPAPVPPPGTTFDPRMMPADWEGTWGEVAMAMWLGRLSRPEYHALHAAAHPACVKAAETR